MTDETDWTVTMDQIIYKTFEDMLNHNLLHSILSNSSDREKITKVKIRPVLIKGVLQYQISEYIGEKVYHTNYFRDKLIERLPDWFEGLFRQAEITSTQGKVILLISKKGKVTVNRRMNKPVAESTAVKNTVIEKKHITESTQARLLSHNKVKNYILQEGTAIPFLIDLGVMTKEGQIVKAKSDKFKQINRFLEFIEDILPFLTKERELTILDFGCGKSYLTFAMYYYLKVLKGYQINVIGLDLKSDVIQYCNELSIKYGYDKLTFLEGDIATYQGSKKVDMVVTLHACDTATDYALYKAVTWGAQVILSVPCCQHELNSQIKNETLKPVLKYGIVKERMAALITDALRAELLETQGYKVQLLEFIDMEHTPKNILIRAVKKGVKKSVESDSKLSECMDFLGVSPCLLNLLKGDKNN